MIACQGRVADRTPGALLGAKLTAEAIAGSVGVNPQFIGEPEEPAEDGWEASLAAADATLGELSSAVGEVLQAGEFPVVVNNTCAASLATLPEVAGRVPDATVLWIDAHGDFNTPATTDSGYLGGMVLSAACGLWGDREWAKLDPENLILVGTRDVDAKEEALLDRAGVRRISPEEATVDRILEECGGSPLWIHVDWDGLEPGHVPAAYRVPDGLGTDLIRDIFTALDPARVAGLEIAEFEATGDQVADQKALDEILRMVGPFTDRLAQ